MKNMAGISTAIADVTDNGAAPTQNGTYDGSSAIYSLLSPFYIRILPITDEWGSGYRIWCGSSATQYGISSPGSDDFLVASFGRDKSQEGFTFHPSLPQAGLFSVIARSDFDKDLIMWNGSWIRSPRAGTESGS